MWDTSLINLNVLGSFSFTSDCKHLQCLFNSGTSFVQTSVRCNLLFNVSVHFCTNYSYMCVDRSDRNPISILCSNPLMSVEWKLFWWFGAWQRFNRTGADTVSPTVCRLRVRSELHRYRSRHATYLLKIILEIAKCWQWNVLFIHRR